MSILENYVIGVRSNILGQFLGLKTLNVKKKQTGSSLFVIENKMTKTGVIFVTELYHSAVRL